VSDGIKWKGKLHKTIFTEEQLNTVTLLEKTKTMRISRQPTTLKVKIDKKPVENVEDFNYLDIMITNDARCT
jgi:hypothetical protein